MRNHVRIVARVRVGSTVYIQRWRSSDGYNPYLWWPEDASERYDKRYAIDVRSLEQRVSKRRALEVSYKERLDILRRDMAVIKGHFNSATSPQQQERARTAHSIKARQYRELFDERRATLTNLAEEIELLKALARQPRAKRF